MTMRDGIHGEDSLREVLLINLGSRLLGIMRLIMLQKLENLSHLSLTNTGPLHGIPYGLKDIIVVPQYKTAWGSKSFKDQVLDIEAWVYKRLKTTGAVLVAKLVFGSLAYHIWFGGWTRNPWNIEEYSTGSSAGPASNTSVETAGSMTYPAARCCVTAMRPTLGTVG